MRRALMLLPLFALAACKPQPDFDQRYDKAASDIEARARAMDKDLTEADKAAAAAAPGNGAQTKGLPAASTASNAPPSSGE